MKEIVSSSIFFGISITLIAYQIGLFLNKKFKTSLFNPLLIAEALVILILAVSNISYESYNNGGKYIGYLLTPATVCLAIPLYEEFAHLKNNWKAILLGIITGVMTSGFSVLALSIAFGFSHTEYVTLLSKSITTAIGIGVTEELNGIVPITIAAIAVAGITGNVTGEFVLKITKITHPIAKGVGLGSASHVLGTSRAMEIGELEGAIASLALTVSGIITVVAASLFATLY